MNELSVCVPTHFRSHQLIECLQELSVQLQKGDELIIGLTTSDEVSIEVMEKAVSLFKCPVILVFESLPSVISKLNRMASKASKPWIVTIDDDAIPDPNWISTIRRKIVDQSIGAIGGRDIQPRLNDVAKQIGIVNFYGRLYGNHEKASSGSREVNFLKGVNLVVRKEIYPINKEMILKGPEPHWEIDLCTRAARRKLKVIYDPEIIVNHFPGYRTDLHRDANANLAYIYNRNLIIAFGMNHEYSKVFRVLFYQFFIGRSPAYGILKLLTSLTILRSALQIWFFAFLGLVDGMRITFNRKHIN